MSYDVYFHLRTGGSFKVPCWGKEELKVVLSFMDPVSYSAFDVVVRI